MGLYINEDGKRISGIAKVGDIKKVGLIQASKHYGSDYFVYINNKTNKFFFSYIPNIRIMED